MKYLMTFSYNGTYYDGYQIQNNKNTIQGVIEKNLTKINSNNKVKMPNIKFDPFLLWATVYPLSLKMEAIIEDVLPLPLLPVTAITFLGNLKYLNIFLFIFKIITPGNELPLLKILPKKIIILPISMLIIFISITPYENYITFYNIFPYFF